MPTVGRTRKSKMIGAPSVPADVYDSTHRRVEGQCWGSATGRSVASAAIQIMRQIVVTAVHWDILLLLVQVVVNSEIALLLTLPVKCVSSLSPRNLSLIHI